jgi:hypothetical protein
MAPQKPRRTPRIATGFDKGYTCNNDDCECDVLDRDTDMDDHTWTCNACGEPVLVEMANDAGRTAYVRRCHAQDVEEGSMIYLEHDMGRAYRVLGSRKGTGKTNGDKWMLGLEEHKGLYFEPDRYINCL